MRASSRLLALLFVSGCSYGSSVAPTGAASPSQAVAARPDATVGAPDMDEAETLRERIVALNRELEAAFRSGKPGAVAMHYAEDAIMLAPGGQRVAGYEAIEAYWSRFDPVDWRLEVFQVEGRDSLAVERGRSTLVYRQEGQEQRSTVEFMLVWTRVPGSEPERWKIAFDAYW